MEGYTTRRAAEKLGPTEHTISNYLFRTYEKLGVSSRVELALYTLRNPQPRLSRSDFVNLTTRVIREEVAAVEDAISQAKIINFCVTEQHVNRPGPARQDGS